MRQNNRETWLLSPALLRMFVLVAGLAAGTGITEAQSGLTFKYSTSDTPSAVLAMNGTIDFPAATPPGTSSANLLLSYQGTSPLNLVAMSATGSGFSVAAFSPAVIQPGATSGFTLLFTPVTSAPANGTLTLQTTTADGQFTWTFALRANVQVPRFVLSYILNPNGNQVAVQDGQTIAFAPAAITQAATATIVVTNAGTAPAYVNDVRIGNGAFALSGLPLLPARLLANQELRFTITFAPTVRGYFNDALVLELSTGRKNILLSGQGLAPVLEFSAGTGASAVVIAPGAQLSLGSAAVGATSSSVISITNRGDADGRVSAISVTGAAFRVLDSPALPATVAPQRSISFTVTFTASSAGPAQGQLRIDSNSFGLSAIGLGPQLTFTAASADATIAVTDNGVIPFANTALGSKTSVVFTITNAGTAAATVGTIAVKGSAFGVPSYPALPASLPANGTLTLTLMFAPDAVGSLNGTLQVDDHTFTLRGNGGAPPSLPAVSFGDVPATATALQQPQVSIHLAQPYPIDLTGTLTLKFTPESFADDPSIQFAAGGRSLAFTIPANTLDAVFGAAQNKAQFQTGSVAGVITFNAAFSIGETDVTPAPAPVTTLAIPAAAPTLRGIQVGIRTAATVELLISGYANNRSLSSFHLDFTPISGATLQNSTLDVSADSSFSAWFQSAASKNYGSQFTASIVINVNGGVDNLQSVSARASNALGISEVVTVALR